MSDDAVAVVERQLAAYNARDLARFAATYAPGVTIYRMPSLQPAIQGQEQLREVYRQRFASPTLHAEILSRIVLGNKVIDHERVTGIRDQPLEALAIYEVSGGLITTVWFYYPAEPFPPGTRASRKSRSSR
jgi:hypothetical protein